VVGEDAGQRRQVAGGVAHRPGQLADRRLPFGHAVEIAHVVVSPLLGPLYRKSRASGAASAIAFARGAA
jgi:hypothetical protein